MIWIVALIAMLVVPVEVWGQEPANPVELVLSLAEGDVLSLEQAVALALKDNRPVKNAALEVEKAQDRVSAAKTLRWPALTFSLLESRLLTPLDFEFKTGVFGTFASTGPIPDKDTKVRTEPRFHTFIAGSVTQPLSQLYRIGLGIERLEVDREITREELRSKRQSVVDDVKRVYYELIQNQSALDAAEESIKYLRELERVTEDYVSQQAVLKFESLEVKARLARTEYEALTFRNTLASQKERLNDLLGRDIRTAFRVTEVPDAAPYEADPAVASARALKQRPEVNAARLHVKQAEYDLRIKKAQYIPDLSLAFNYLSPLNIEVVPQNILTVGLLLSWDVYDWGRKAREMAERRKAIDQASNQLHEAEPRVVMDVNTSLRKLQETRELMRSSQLAREAAQEKVRVTLNRYTLQAALLKDALEAQAALADASRQYQQALSSFWTARAALEKALGEE